MRTLSQTALQAALAETTSEVYLECLTISGTGIASPMMFVNDKKDLVRSAGTFLAFPFQFTYQKDTDQQVPVAKLKITNVDQRIVQNIRGLADSPTLTYELVLASSPNTVEFGPIDFRMDNMNNQMQWVTFDLGIKRGFLNLAFPGNYFRPGNTGA